MKTQRQYSNEDHEEVAPGWFRFQLGWVFAWTTLFAICFAIYATDGFVFWIILLAGSIAPLLLFLHISIIVIKDRFFSKPDVWEPANEDPLGIPTRKN